MSTPSLVSDAGLYSYEMDTYSPDCEQTDYDTCNDFHYSSLLAIDIVSLVISSFELVTNGIVIWVLGCRAAKVYPFTIYILNLAIADIGVLISRAVCCSHQVVEGKLISLDSVYFQFFMFTFLIGQMLLGVSGTDRCVSVFFPIWHRYYQPSYLSIVVCIVLWILSFLIFAFYFISFSFDGPGSIGLYPVKMISLVCLPLLIISTIILLVKLCCKTLQSQGVALLKAITIALTFSLLYATPLNVICILNLFLSVPIYVLELSYLGACLNSSTNPLVYFLVGRKKVDQSRGSIKVTLQRVFQEEGDSIEETELDSPVQI